MGLDVWGPEFGNFLLQIPEIQGVKRSSYGGDCKEVIE
jgi:hypothetical protein